MAFSFCLSLLETVVTKYVLKEPRRFSYWGITRAEYRFGLAIFGFTLTTAIVYKNNGIWLAININVSVDFNEG